ncbi:LysR substrate-binding domain-containing protein [Sphingosinicella sp. BN140058]|uniref:LysR substrate-binding domain-containing protein n=1 Tax=Sphingosinicella sp. BN140058 TaxID=1892855 RepID=UPI00352A8635
MADQTVGTVPPSITYSDAVIVEEIGETVQVDLEGPITPDEASLSRAVVLSGIGLGFFMEPDVLADIRAGRLVRVLEDWTPPLSALCLYHRGRRNASVALRAFVALARELRGKADASDAGASAPAQAVW